MATVDRGHFAKRLLDALDAPHSQRNLNALVAWQSAEGTRARYNPLATTRQMPGATDFNTTHVKNYKTVKDGVEATKLTLLESGHGYEGIVKGLRENKPAKVTLEAVKNSSWGTGVLALEILPDVKEDYASYAGKPIGQ